MRQHSPQRELHPRLAREEKHRLFLRGVELFNDERFFDCHEAFEEIWRSTTPEPVNLFQGLIQVAVGFYHYFDRRRPDVARRVMAKGRHRLETLPWDAVWPKELGLDYDVWTATFLHSVNQWEVWLTALEGPAPRVPQLVLRTDD